MDKKLKLTLIEFETENGEEVSLSLDEAKDLYDQLHELFNKKSALTLPPLPTAPSDSPHGLDPYPIYPIPRYPGDMITYEVFC